MTWHATYATYAKTARTSHEWLSICRYRRTSCVDIGGSLITTCLCKLSNFMHAFDIQLLSGRANSSSRQYTSNSVGPLWPHPPLAAAPCTLLSNSPSSHPLWSGAAGDDRLALAMLSKVWQPLRFADRASVEPLRAAYTFAGMLYSGLAVSTRPVPHHFSSWSNSTQ